MEEEIISARDHRNRSSTPDSREGVMPTRENRVMHLGVGVDESPRNFAAADGASRPAAVAGIPGEMK